MRKAAPRREPAGGDQQHRVARDRQPPVVHQHDAVAVAVEGGPEVASLLDDGAAEKGGVRRAASAVDVPPVRSIVQDHGGEPQAAEDRGRESARGAVGAVDRHPERGRDLDPPENPGGVIEVGLGDGDPLDRRRRGRRRRVGSGDRRGDPGLEVRAGLLAAGREHLDAVVLIGIVRGGDDQPGVVAPVPDQERHRGRGQHPRVDRPGRRAGHALGQRFGHPLPGLARVAADEDPAGARAAAACRGDRGRQANQRRPVQRRLAGGAPHPVGPEQAAGHRCRGRLSPGRPTRSGRRRPPPGRRRRGHGQWESSPGRTPA